MESLDILKMTLDLKKPDKVPIDLDVTTVTGINIKAYKDLFKYLSLEKNDFRIRDTLLQLVWVHEDILEKLKLDIRTLNSKVASNWLLKINELEDGSKCYKDQDGIG